jgi:hypothetical protein
VTFTATAAGNGRHEAADDTAWDVVGSAEAWEALLTGQSNLGVALRRCELRYCDGSDEAEPMAAEARISMLAEFLALEGSAWSSAVPQPTTADGPDGR